MKGAARVDRSSGFHQCSEYPRHSVIIAFAPTVRISERSGHAVRILLRATAILEPVKWRPQGRKPELQFFPSFVALQTSMHKWRSGDQLTRVPFLPASRYPSAAKL